MPFMDKTREDRQELNLEWDRACKLQLTPLTGLLVSRDAKAQYAEAGVVRWGCD